MMNVVQLFYQSYLRYELVIVVMIDPRNHHGPIPSFLCARSQRPRGDQPSHAGAGQQVVVPLAAEKERERVRIAS